MHTATISNVRYFVLMITLFAAGWLPSGPAGAQEPKGTQTVAVIGTGDVYRDSISAAREKAISNSLVSAVKTVVADLLSIEALVTHFPTLNHLLFEQTRQYVQDYKVLTEFKYGRKYRVLVQATVMVDKVIQQLSSVGINPTEKFLPRILFFITEQNPENSWPQYWWGGEDSSFLITAAEQALAENMKKKGFTVIDHRFPAPDAQMEPVYYKSELSDAEAIGIGSRLEADVVIVGTSVARDVPNTMGENLRSFKGTVTARAVRTDTGEVIARTVQTAFAVNADETAGGRAAIAAAGNLASGELARQIAALWRKEIEKPGMVEIKVTGTRNLAGFVKLRKIMSGTYGVNGIQVTEIKANEATVVVDYQSDAQELAAALMMNDFETFGIHISDITPGHLTIDIVQEPNTTGSVTTD